MRQAQAEQAAAAQRLAEQKEALARQLRASYMMGRGGKAELLLSQQDPDRVDRMLVYYDSLNRARAASIAAIDVEIKKVAELQTQYQAQHDSLHALSRAEPQESALRAGDRIGRQRIASRRR